MSLICWFQLSASEQPASEDGSDPFELIASKSDVNQADADQTQQLHFSAANGQYHCRYQSVSLIHCYGSVV